MSSTKNEPLNIPWQYISERVFSTKTLAILKGMGCLNSIDLSDIVNLHGKAIYGFCHKLAKNKDDTEDLYQETFLKAMELCHKIDKNDNPKGFIISIAIRLWKNKRRKYAWRQKIAPTEELNDNIVSCYMPNNELYKIF